MRCVCSSSPHDPIVLAAHLVSQRVQLLLAINVAGGQLSWRENRLADVLRVVHDPLIEIFAEDYGGVVRSHLAVVVAEDRVEHVLLPVGLLADHLRAAERVESVVAWAVTAHELPVWQSVHRFGGVEADLPIVNGVTRGALVPHRVRIAHIERGAVGHEARHGLHRHASLVQAREGRDLDLRLQDSVFLQAESRRGRVTNVPKVILRIHYLHVDPLSCLLISHILVLLLESSMISVKSTINQQSARNFLSNK